MKHIYPVVFSFGETLRYKIDEQDQKYYLSTCRALINNEECNWGNTTASAGATKEPFYSIPIFSHSPSLDSDILRNLFKEWSTSSFPIIEDGKLINNDIIVLIEIKGINRDQLIYPLSNFITDVLNTEPLGSPRFIFFLDKLPSDDDKIFSHLNALVTDQKVILIDSEGNHVGTCSSSFKIEKYKSSREYRDLDSSQGIRRKLIKKHGHFQRLDGTGHCSRFFFDAHYCQAEIKDLILKHIDKHAFESEKFEYIIQLSKISEWLSLSVSSADGVLLSDGKEKYKNYKGVINFHNIDDYGEIVYEGGEILLVTDVIDSGKSIRDCIPKLFETFKGLTSENLMKLSVLNNIKKGNYDSSTKRRKVHLNGIDFYFSYMVEIEAIELLHSKCPQCQLNLEHTPISGDLKYELTSFDYWELNKTHELIPEKYGFSSRDAMLNIPNFLKWFENDAPFFAYKFELALRSYSINHPLTIVFPDETVNESGVQLTLEETASGKFVKRLKEIFKNQYIQYIGIPRKIIDDIRDEKIEVSELNNLNTEDWVYNLENLPPEQKIIIVDEFHRGGSTFESMFKIVSYFKKKPICYFPIVDFNPNKSKTYAEIYDGIQVLTLYSFNLVS